MWLAANFFALFTFYLLLFTSPVLFLRGGILFVYFSLDRSLRSLFAMGDLADDLEKLSISPKKKPQSSSSIFLQKKFNSLSNNQKQRSKPQFDRQKFFSDEPIAVNDDSWNKNRQYFNSQQKENPLAGDSPSKKAPYHKDGLPTGATSLKKPSGNVILNPASEDLKDHRDGIQFVKTGFDKYAKSDSPFKDPYSILNNKSIERSGASFLDSPELFKEEKEMVDKLVSSIGNSVMEDEIAKLKETEFEEKDRQVKGLTVNLLDHQVLGLKFLRKREKDKHIHKGGLLCDDMGLGKTVQMISLIVKNKAKEDDLGNLADIENKEFKVVNTAVPKVKIKATLVIAPVSLTTQWIQEMKRFAPHLKTLLYHGPNRAKTSLVDYDVVVSSYETVRSDFENKASPIYSAYWHRVVLDEAHIIKNGKTKTAKATFNVESTRRWALTGTPIQNSVKELQSLLLFLRVSDLSNEKVWKATMAKLISKEKTQAFELIRKELKTIMLRRTKEILQHTNFKLPEKTIHKCEIDFSKRERKLYSDLHEHFKNDLMNKLKDKPDDDDFDESTDLFKSVSPVKLGAKKNGKNIHMQALVFLLRLRQVCCHWKLLTNLKEDDLEDIQKANGGANNNKLDPMASPSKTPAPLDMDKALDNLANIMGGLTVEETKCEVCFVEPVESGEGKICRSCLKLQEHTKNTESAKVLKVLDILKRDPTRKTIIFSQFRELLLLLKPVLKKHGIKSVMYDGKLSLSEKDKALDKLRNDDETKVLLCSLKSGAVGLNLTVASQVILFDPWWNPQIQEQAIDRVYRIGQTKPVDVYVLAIKDTVEIGILELQEKKRAIAQTVIGGDSTAQSKLNTLSTAELMKLFGAYKG